MKALANGAYRFSISWPRIFPHGTGAPNSKGSIFMTGSTTRRHGNALPDALPLGLAASAARSRRMGTPRHRRGIRPLRRLRCRKLSECWTVVEQGHATGVFAPGLKLPPGRLNQLRHHVLLAHGLAVQAIRARSARGHANWAGGQRHCLRSCRRNPRARRGSRARHPRAQCALPDRDDGRPLPRVLLGGCRRRRPEGRGRGHERDQYPGRFRRPQRLSAG